VKFSAKIDSKASAITPTCSKISTSPSIWGTTRRLAGIEFFNGIGQTRTSLPIGLMACSSVGSTSRSAGGLPAE
jgi:hypothetical protein